MTNYVDEYTQLTNMSGELLPEEYQKKFELNQTKGGSLILSERTERTRPSQVLRRFQYKKVEDPYTKFQSWANAPKGQSSERYALTDKLISWMSTMLVEIDEAQQIEIIESKRKSRLKKERQRFLQTNYQMFVDTGMWKLRNRATQTKHDQVNKIEDLVWCNTLADSGSEITIIEHIDQLFALEFLEKTYTLDKMTELLDLRKKLAGVNDELWKLWLRKDDERVDQK